MAKLPTNAGALIGQQFGNYKLLALLAVGGTSEIYLASRSGAEGFEKHVVVKCLHEHLTNDGEYVKMFLDEARVGGELHHQNIVETLELGEHGKRYYMAMEYLPGMSLALIARRCTDRLTGGKIPSHLVMGMTAQVCAGLYYAHDRKVDGRNLRLVHRDISPQNIVVTFDGVVKLVDFGIAKSSIRNSRTRAGMIKGKFAYMSPEQCKTQEVDRRTDIFALGIIVHELLTGRRLFKRTTTYDTYQAILSDKIPTPSSWNHELDPSLDAIVMKALAFEKEDRYSSAREFGQAMQQELHRWGKSASQLDLAEFFKDHFDGELALHDKRMRILLDSEGLAAEDSPWSTGDSPRDIAADTAQWSFDGEDDSDETWREGYQSMNERDQSTDDYKGGRGESQIGEADAQRTSQDMVAPQQTERAPSHHLDTQPQDILHDSPLGLSGQGAMPAYLDAPDPILKTEPELEDRIAREAMLSGISMDDGAGLPNAQAPGVANSSHVASQATVVALDPQLLVASQSTVVATDPDALLGRDTRVSEQGMGARPSAPHPYDPLSSSYIAAAENKTVVADGRELGVAHQQTVVASDVAALSGMADPSEEKTMIEASIPPQLAAAMAQTALQKEGDTFQEASGIPVPTATASDNTPLSLLDTPAGLALSFAMFASVSFVFFFVLGKLFA